MEKIHVMERVGVVKNAVTRSVKSDVNVTIDGPREFHDFCSKNLAKAPVKPDGSCNHSRRTFYLVKEGDIQRERPTRTNVDTVVGTRKLHAVAGISPYLLHKRRLSCFCSPCQDLNSVAPCINLEFVKSWSERKMSAKGISFEATTSSDMEAADVGHAEMDEIPVCTLESATDNATGATVGKSSSERSETGDLSEVGNAGGILTSNKVDYDESEVVQTQLDVLNEKVLKDLFCDVCLPENKHEALLKPQQRGIEIRLEEYYAVFYDNEFYIGRLLEKDGEEYLFKFLHRVCSASKMYDWPIRSDSEKVLGKFVIDGPLTLVGSGPFSVQEIENVEKTYAEMKAITQAEL